MAPLYPLPIGRQVIYGKHRVGTNVDIDRDPKVGRRNNKKRDLGEIDNLKNNNNDNNKFHILFLHRQREVGRIVDKFYNYLVHLCPAWKVEIPQILSSSHDSSKENCSV